jgi:hypothetical protein
MATSQAVPPRFELDLPVDAEAVMTFSPPHSQSRAPTESFAQRDARGQVDIDERVPLLGSARKDHKPFYRPRPLW